MGSVMYGDSCVGSVVYGECAICRSVLYGECAV